MILLYNENTYLTNRTDVDKSFLCYNLYMPGGTTSKLYWVYILLSLSDNKRYIGFTTGLKLRLKEHFEGRVFSTKYRRPLILMYAECCLNEADARRREKYFKTTDGRRFLAKRLKCYYLEK